MSRASSTVAYDAGRTQVEVVVLENLWRKQVRRACRVAVALGLGARLPHDVVAHIAAFQCAPSIVVARVVGVVGGGCSATAYEVSDG